ncbi:MAG: barstar family protein [Lachnospiraceae bacterium]|nr:barstar family protein [Lachnospiraceae bacterium]
MDSSQNQGNSKIRVFYVDVTGAYTPGDFQERIVHELPVPSYYGRNLDALYDMLTEYGKGWNLIFYGCGLLKRYEPKYFATVERLCGEACAETPCLKIRFFG